MSNSLTKNLPANTVDEGITEDLTIVIPAFNEASSLSVQLPGWIRRAEETGWTLIIVDDGSTDSTEVVLEKIGPSENLRILQHSMNRGYGAALKTGIYQASTHYVATMDADGQHDIETLNHLLEVARTSGAELVIGSRKDPTPGQLYRRFGKALIRQLAMVLFSFEIDDLNSGLRVYKTAVVQKLLPYCPDSMAFSDISMLMHLNTKCRVQELPISTQPRSSGDSTINTMTAVDTVIEILNVVMWFRPLKLLLPIAGLVMGIGALWAMPFLLAGRGLSIAALLLLLGGYQLGILALLAEQAASIRRLDIPEVGYTEISGHQGDPQ